MIILRQVAILEFIRRHIREQGYSPTIREISSAVGIPSTSTVRYHLKKLEAAGEIRRGGYNRERSLAISGSYSACPGDRVVVEIEGGERVTAVFVGPADRAAQAA